MATPTSGPISMNDIVMNFQFASGTPISLNNTSVRASVSTPSGAISIGQFYNQPTQTQPIGSNLL